MNEFATKEKKAEPLDPYRFLPEKGEVMGELVGQQPRTYARWAAVDKEGKIIPIAPDPIPLDVWAHVVLDGVVQSHIKRVKMRSLKEVAGDLIKALDVVQCEKKECGWEAPRKERDYDRKCKKCGGDTVWFIDEYMNGPNGYIGEPTHVPHNFRGVACYPVTGGSEGHYVHVEFVVQADRCIGQEAATVRLALAKTFRGMDHAAEIARRCAILLGA